jgi:hypothetical protein
VLEHGFREEKLTSLGRTEDPQKAGRVHADNFEAMLITLFGERSEHVTLLERSGQVIQLKHVPEAASLKL